MNFNNSDSTYYSNSLISNKYFYLQRAKEYSQPPYSPRQAKDTSIDDILLQDSTALLDKLVNTAFTITYRLKLYREINYSLDRQWNEIRAEVSDLSVFYPGSNMNAERRKSMLTKKLLGIEKMKLEHKVQCWKDLVYPTNYFTGLFHKHLEQKADQSILRG